MGFEGGAFQAAKIAIDETTVRQNNNGQIYAISVPVGNSSRVQPLSVALNTVATERVAGPYAGPYIPANTTIYYAVASEANDLSNIFSTPGYLTTSAHPYYIDIAWTTPSDLTGIENILIGRSVDGGFSFQIIATLAPDETAYTDEGNIVGAQPVSIQSGSYTAFSEATTGGQSMMVNVGIGDSGSWQLIGNTNQVNPTISDWVWFTPNLSTTTGVLAIFACTDFPTFSAPGYSVVTLSPTLALINVLDDGSGNMASTGSMSPGSLGTAGAAAHIFSGTGSPQGVVTGVAGDLYIQADGGLSTYLYRCTGTTNWTALVV